MNLRSIYAISFMPGFKNIRVARYEDRKDAEAYMKVPPTLQGDGGFIVQDEGDLRGVHVETLKSLYNAWLDEGEKPVNKFESRNVAHSRFLIRLEMRFQNLPASKAPVESKTPVLEEPAHEQPQGEPGAETQESDMATKAAKVKKEKVKKEKTNGASRVQGKPAGTVASFKQVRPGTARQKILKHMAAGNKSVKQIAEAVGLDEKTVLVHANTMHRDCGIGYAVEDGKLVASFPGSKTYDDAVKAEPPAK